MEGYAAYLGILQTAVSLREPDIKCAFNATVLERLRVGRR